MCHPVRIFRKSTDLQSVKHCYGNRMVHQPAFSYDVKAAITVFQNKETAAMLMYQAISPGIKLYFYTKIVFFNMAAVHVSENALLNWCFA